MIKREKARLLFEELMDAVDNIREANSPVERGNREEAALRLEGALMQLVGTVAVRRRRAAESAERRAPTDVRGRDQVSDNELTAIVENVDLREKVEIDRARIALARFIHDARDLIGPSFAQAAAGAITMAVDGTSTWMAGAVAISGVPRTHEGRKMVRIVLAREAGYFAGRWKLDVKTACIEAVRKFGPTYKKYGAFVPGAETLRQRISKGDDEELGRVFECEKLNGQSDRKAGVDRHAKP